MKDNRTNDDSSWGSGLTYASGFGLSLILTMAAYFLVRHHLNAGHVSPSDRFMVIALLALGLTQLLVQLVFFLHLDRESKPRWNLSVLLFAILIVFILVAGSLWIMYHLNYRMSPDQMNHYLLQQDGGV